MIKKRTYYTGFIIWSLIYITGILIAPAAPNRFNLTAAKTKLLQITIALPVVLIWGAAIYGAERFKNYTSGIKYEKDGSALDRVALGLIVLIGSVMSSGISGILRPWAIRDGWLKTFTIIFNYLQVLLPLIAFYIMFKGSSELKKLVVRKKENILSWLPVTLIIIVVGALYITVLLSYAYKNTTPDPSKYSSFYLSDPLIILTLALPYLLGWALGIKSTMNIAAYQKKVKGLIYKSALKRLVVGLYTVIGFAIILQLLTAFSTFFAKAGLGSILLIIYMIIIIYSVGFIIIASGAKRLGNIEKVNR